ncbi:MAG: YhcH/YjgK/YiaL family protein [Muribaculaceae bacterium]|nr:YhcH/YjgK/YiaL family protein [Muribaculaceae bacterium]
MIIGTFKDPYNGLDRSSLVRFALDEARKVASSPFVAGSVTVLNDAVKINSQKVEGRATEAAPLESHKRFIDIHIPISSPERFGWSPTEALTSVDKEYDADNDIIFFNDEPQIYFDIFPGQFVIFFPGDAHAPLIGTGTIRKLCVKIPV